MLLLCGGLGCAAACRVADIIMLMLWLHVKHVMQHSCLASGKLLEFCCCTKGQTATSRRASYAQRAMFDV